MKSNKVLLGARIKELRKSRDISQEKLAEEIEVDPKHLSRIEAGRGYPSLNTLENIAITLKVEMRDLFEFQHLDSVEEVEVAVNALLKTANEDEKRVLLKLFRVFVR